MGTDNCATGEFKDMPMEYWDSQIALNLNAAAYCSRYAVADMVEKKTKGKIVNISSVHSRVTWGCTRIRCPRDTRRTIRRL